MNREKNGKGIIQGRSKPLLWLLFIFVILAVFIAVIGFISYRKQKKQIFLEQTNQLRAVADLKAAEIENWFMERFADAHLILHNADRTAKLSACLRPHPAASLLESVRFWMTIVQKTNHYENVMLLDRKGGTVLAASAHHAGIGTGGIPTLEQACASQDAVLSDMHSDPLVPHIHLDLAIPLLNDNKCAGFVILRIDPFDFLFPLIQSWPTPSPTAETLLVRREGGDVLFLSPLRHRANTAMKLRIPLSRNDVPAVHAAQGRHGLLRGRDYRNIRVWAVARPVSGTTWSMVAKVDEAEILAPLFRQFRQVFLTALALILAAAAMVLLLWQRQDARARLRLLEAENQQRALVTHFDYLSRYANDIIILSDEKHDILEANERAVQTYGYSREQLLAMNIHMLRAPCKRDSMDDDYRQVEKRDGIVFETQHKKKDGSIFPVEVSTRAIIQDGNKYFQSIIRDISERKRAETALHESESLLRAIATNFPNSYLSIIEKDLRIGFTSGQEFKKQNLDPRNFIGLTLEQVFDEHAPQVREHYQQAFAGEERSFELYINNQYQSYHVVPLPAPDGTIPRILAVVENISERKRTEIALRESEERFHRTLDNMLEGCQIIGPDWRYLYVNAAVTRHGHARKEDLIGRTMLEVYPGIENTEMFTALAHCMTERIPQQLENEFTYPDGARQWFELSVQPVPEGIFILSIDITERKQAERRLRENHTLLRIAGQLARIGGWNVNLEENRSYWSDEVAAIHEMPPGYSPLVEEGISFYAPEWRERITKVFNECAQNGVPYNEEMEIITATGKRLWVHTMGEAVRNEKGMIYKVHGAFQDITERKRVEEELRSLSTRNQAILEAVPDIIMGTDVNKVYTWANHAGIQFFGDDVIGREAAFYFDGEQDTYQAVKPLFDGNEDLLYIESWQRRRDGEKRLLAWWCRVLKDAAGNVSGSLASARDITERIHEEAELKELTRQLQIRNRIAEIALTVSDENFFHEVLAVVLQATQSRFGVFGYLDEEGALVVPTMTRQIWDKCQVPEKDIVFPRCQWGDSIWPTSIRRKETLYSNEPSLKIPAGHVPVRRNISLPILFGGDAIGLFQVANKECAYTADDIHMMETIAEFVAPLLHARLQRDLQERSRQKAEEKIRQLNEALEQRVELRTTQLEAANKELEAFSYSVSHDLRAPLRAIAGFARIVNEEYAPRLDGEGRRLLTVIDDNTQKMGRLIDDLLSFSRLNRQAVQQSSIDLAALAREVFAEMRTQEKGRKMEIKIGRLPLATGDRTMLRHVLQNLLANAVKFTRPRKIARIEIGGRTEMDGNVYFIKDNGVGFDPRYGHKLFGVFQRLHASSEFEGTGVGLAIVQRIVIRHGGRVWAEGEVGKGATFYFALPKQGGNHD